MRFLITTKIEKSFGEVFQRFDLELFKALKPPLMNLDVIRFDGCRKGDEVHLIIGLGPISQNWVSHITEHGGSSEEHYFIDEGQVLPPPLKSWKHCHRVIKISDNSCFIHDDITYSSGVKLLDILIFPVLYAQFWSRKPQYKKYFRN